MPNLCADRIDYNIQGAYYQKFITYEEALSIFKDLHFINNQWVSSNQNLIKKLIHFSLFMTENCWGSLINGVTSKWLADAILRAIDLGCISHTDFHYGTDQEIWDKLITHKDPFIQKKMDMIINHQDYFSIVNNNNEANYIVKSKFRGINPLILSNSKYARITDIDDQLAKDYDEVRQRINKGWLIKIKTD